MNCLHVLDFIHCDSTALYCFVQLFSHIAASILINLLLLLAYQLMPVDISRQCVGCIHDTCSQLTWKSHSPHTHGGTFWPTLTPAQTLYLHESCQNKPKSEVCKMATSLFDIRVASSSVYSWYMQPVDLKLKHTQTHKHTHRQSKQSVKTVEKRHTLLASSGWTVSTAVCLMNSSNSWTRTERPLCIGLRSVYMFAKSTHTDTLQWKT